MKYRIGKRTFEWTMDHRALERTGGIVAVVGRRAGTEGEVYEAVATANMLEAARELAEGGRLQRDRPGVVLGFISLATGRAEAIEIAESLRGRRWIQMHEQAGPEEKRTLGWHDLAGLAHASGMRALRGAY